MIIDIYIETLICSNSDLLYYEFNGLQGRTLMSWSIVALFCTCLPYAISNNFQAFRMTLITQTLSSYIQNKASRPNYFCRV